MGTAGLSHNFNPKPTQAAFGASYSDSSQLDTVAHSDSNVARTYMMPLITGAYDMGPVQYTHLWTWPLESACFWHGIIIIIKSNMFCML